MDQCQHPHGVAVNLIHKTVVVVRNQFTSAGDLAGTPQLWKINQPRGSVAEQLVHPGSGSHAIGRDVFPHLVPILFGFRGPDNLHALLAAFARRFANLASTSSFERPRPARSEARAASTLVLRNSSYSRVVR